MRRNPIGHQSKRQRRVFKKALAAIKPGQPVSRERQAKRFRFRAK